MFLHSRLPAHYLERFKSGQTMAVTQVFGQQVARAFRWGSEGFSVGQPGLLGWVLGVLPPPVHVPSCSLQVTATGQHVVDHPHIHPLQPLLSFLCTILAAARALEYPLQCTPARCGDPPSVFHMHTLIPLWVRGLGHLPFLHPDPVPANV